MKRNISGADSLQREAEQSAPIYFWFWQRKTHFHWMTAAQFKEKSLFLLKDDLRKCPITGQLLLPAGSLLEQLSVSVSVGKSLKYRPIMRLELLRKAWP